jgi:hypothetical protein
MFGAGVPSRIWRQFLDSVTKALEWKQADFPQRVNTGDPEKFGNGIKPVEPPNPGNCALTLIGLTCDGNGGNNNGGNGPGGPGGGNGGPGGGNNNGGNGPGGGNVTNPFNQETTAGADGGD